jgi:hypothetical protein
MDDHVAQFLVSVGNLCADARLGGLTVRLVLDNGEQVVGMAAPPPESDGSDELDSTGYVDCVWVGGVTVPLSEVVEATVQRPTGERPEAVWPPRPPQTSTGEPEHERTGPPRTSGRSRQV